MEEIIRAAIPVMGRFFQNVHSIIKVVKPKIKLQGKRTRKEGSNFGVIAAEVRAIRSKGALLPGIESSSSQMGPKMFIPSIL